MENPCSNCDSTSMEMCLLIRHCEHFVTKKSKEESRCKDYVGVTCVNGGCPNAMADEYPEYGYEHCTCEDCGYYEGCGDCCFADKPEYCSDSEKEKYREVT